MNPSCAKVAVTMPLLKLKPVTCIGLDRPFTYVMTFLWKFHVCFCFIIGACCPDSETHILSSGKSSNLAVTFIEPLFCVQVYQWFNLAWILLIFNFFMVERTIFVDWLIPTYPNHLSIHFFMNLLISRWLQ